MGRSFRSLKPALGGAFLLAFLIFQPGNAWAGKLLQITSFSYDQHFRPGEIISFTVTVKNNEPTNQGAELVILANPLSAGETLTLADEGSGNGAVPAGGSFTFQRTVAAPAAGVYTINFLLLDGDGVRVDQVKGKFPLHVGTETESLRVFPEFLNLGTLPPGRFMHPVPLEVSWSYFRFNRLRLDQPFTIRIYTDNAARYHGVPNALEKSSAAGLVSLDGKYTIPLKVWTLNFGPDIQETGWESRAAGPPPVEDDDYWIGPPLLEGARSQGSASWVRLPDLADMTTNPISWRRLIGQDPHDSRFVSDSNPTGDFTLLSPFTFYLAMETGASAVSGSYSTTLVVELWTP